MRRTLLLFALGLALAACGSTPAAAPEGAEAAGTHPWVSQPAVVDCAPPIAAPALPEVVPGEAGLDPATGLHVTGTPVVIDAAAWRLEVTGLVDRPLSLTYDEFRCMPKVEAAPLLDCPGYFQDQASWAGVPLEDVLDAAGVRPDATGVRLVAADGYYRDFELTPELRATAFLAYEVNGETLPVLHGFPVRLVWPGHEGWNWVKWLVGIEVH